MKHRRRHKHRIQTEAPRICDLMPIRRGLFFAELRAIAEWQKIKAALKSKANGQGASP